MESISEKVGQVSDIAAEKDGSEEESAEAESTEAADEEVASESEADLMKLKKDELVAMAKEKGVASSGTKADIVARILE